MRACRFDGQLVRNQDPTSRGGSPRGRHRRRPWPRALPPSEMVSGGDAPKVCPWPRGGSAHLQSSWRLSFVGRRRTMTPACTVGETATDWRCLQPPYRGCLTEGVPVQREFSNRSRSPRAQEQVLDESTIAPRRAAHLPKRGLARPHDVPVNPVPVWLAARHVLCDKRDGFRRRTIYGGSVTDHPPNPRSERRGAAFA